MLSTDLLQTLLPASQRAVLEAVREVASAAGLATYLVGGCVRDLVLGITPGDIDFVVEGPNAAPRLARALARRHGGKVTVHKPFVTATWFRPNGRDGPAAIDVATARTEIYEHPAALPQVRPASIVDDLRRRDFTINALAVRVDGNRYGELLDPFRGEADLQAKQVRVLHPQSFRDDPTRMFRAVRYEQRLGFQIAESTLPLIPAAMPALAMLTGDRARRELELVFRESEAAPMLARLDELGVLRGLHSALRWGQAETARAAIVRRLPLPEWKLSTPIDPDAIFLALLLREAPAAEVAAALERLNPNGAVVEAVRAATGLQLHSTRPSEVVAQLDGLSEAALAAAYVLHPGARASLHDYLAHWRFVSAETTGDDLIALGLTPGPQFKRLLWALRAARLDGAVADRESERALVERMTREAPA